MEGQSRRRHYADVALQLGLVLGAILVYFGVRGITEGSITPAIAHGQDILHVERAFSIDIEGHVQSFVTGHRWLTTLANWIYIWGHWPVIAATLIWLFHTRRDEYLLLRNAMFVSGAIGIVIFATFPVAPPRLLPDSGYVDTVTDLSRSYRVLQPPALVNHYAAMPSLHVGWNLLVGIAVVRVARPRALRWVGVASPLLMAFAVVATANHYVLDPIVGSVIALVGFLVAWLWSSRHRVQRPVANVSMSSTIRPATPMDTSRSAHPTSTQPHEYTRRPDARASRTDWRPTSR
jgi:hypothetical protein